jgi:hypothetical protein
MFEAEYLAALWIDAGHHMFDRAVLAGGIHRLEDQQHRLRHSMNTAAAAAR